MRSGFPWFAFAVLLGAGLMGNLAVLPFTKKLLSVRISGPAALRNALILQFIQNVLLLALCIGFGLKAARATGLAPSAAQEWTDGVPGLRVGWLRSLLAGAMSAGGVCLLDYFVCLPRLPALREAARPIATLPLRHKLLAALYGAFAEELLLRLGAFTLLVWLSKALLHWESPPLWVLWPVNVATALLFGALHLPAAAALTPLTPGVIGRTLLLNSIVGLAFGFVYFTYGLESAILAHFAAAAVLQLASRVPVTA